jgi:Domain of unknown function (DUF4395)
MSALPNKVDTNALKFNQLTLIILNVLAFIFDVKIIPAVLAVLLLTGAAFPKAALLKLIYRSVIVPLKILTPKIAEESPAPHLFAQLVGGIFLATGSIFLFLQNVDAGWILVWIVIVLAAVNVFFGFCAGCFVYFQLGKLGVPGFGPHKS